MKELWMVDLEGTLTQNGWRQHLITGPDKDWRQYYKGLLADDPHPQIKDLVCLLPLMSPPRQVIIYTTRMPNKYDMERKWLAGERIGYERLLMRENMNLKGPELLREWCLVLKPEYVIDDREENRKAVEDIVPHVFSPEDITNIEITEVEDG